VCAKIASGHSGQPPFEDPPFTRDPSRIHVEVLRDFVREQLRLRRIRPLAEAWGVGHETLRKFAEGKTRQPHPRQVELYGTKFLELHPSGYVREKRVDGVPQALEQLKMVLPPGRENAEQVIEKLRELADRHAAELPDEAVPALEWMRKLLNAEYDAEGRYRPPRRSHLPVEAPEKEG